MVGVCESLKENLYGDEKIEVLEKLFESKLHLLEVLASKKNHEKMFQEI
jgi:hypothetical protein